MSIQRVAVGYARTSGNINPKSSIPNQHKLITEYCKNHNILLREMLTDEEKSGMRVEGRKGYIKLKSLVANQLVDMVIVSYFDRLARDTFEFMKLTRELITKDVEVISVSENLSTRTMENVHLMMIGFEVEHENNQRTERFQHALSENRKKESTTLLKLLLVIERIAIQSLFLMIRKRKW